jgi:hypothetical protein
MSTQQTRSNLLRGIFLALEIVLVASGAWFWLIQIFTNPRAHNITFIEDTVGGVYAASTLILLLGSPWFIKSLGRIAILGWVLALISLLSALLMPALS